MTADRMRWIPIALTLLAVAAVVYSVVQYFYRGPEPGTTEYDIEQLVEILDQTPGINLDRSISDITREKLAASVAMAVQNAPDHRRWKDATTGRQPRPNDISKEQRAKLAQLFADWVTLRADADSAGYISWMENRGGRLRTDDPKIDGRDKSYEAATGIPYSENVTDEELFASMFDATMRWQDGIIRPVDLADIEMRFGWCRSSQPDIENELIPDQYALLWWGGKTTHSGIRYFDAPRTYEKVLQRSNRVLGGAVFAACLGQSGDWIVIRFYAYWDPTAKDWWINNITATNLSGRMIGTGIVY